jgi:hypothetical protein
VSAGHVPAVVASPKLSEREYVIHKIVMSFKEACRLNYLRLSVIRYQDKKKIIFTPSFSVE